MTAIVTWNIQCGLGVDGQVDLVRIARVIRAMGEPDLICLQEVCRFMPDLDKGAGADQVAHLSDLFPGYQPVFGAAVDRGARGQPRQSLGNLILTRLAPLSLFRHHLPQPAEAGLRHMPRQAIELTVAAAFGPLRVVTTHLEYHSESHRQAQITRLRELHGEASANVREPPQAVPSGPYRRLERPEDLVLCGDLNLLPDGPEYAALSRDFDDGAPGLIDAWRRLHGDRRHDPTCGIFDKAQWPGEAHCRDYFFLTPRMATRATALDVDMGTDASDHQPVLLALAD